MTSAYISFLKHIMIFSMILGLIAALLYFILPPKFITPALLYLFLFFIGVTLTGYYFLINSVRKKFIKFLNAYLLSTIIKLLLYIAVMVVYILINRQDALPFGITFFLLYLCYTIFEITSLISYSKSIEKK